MAIYFDTGVLLKLFVAESNSPQVIALAASLGQPLIFSDFQHAELIVALHCKVGRKEISAADAAAVEARISREVKLGILVRHEPTWKRIFSRTIRLAQRHGSKTLCRTLDAIHVSIALASGVTQFATLDHRQATLAKLAGLVVVQP